MAHYYALPRYLGELEGSQIASLHAPLPALFPGIRSLSQITLLVTGPGIVPAHHWASVSMLCQPCNYSNKTITSTCGNQGAPPPLDTTNIRPVSLLVSSVPGVALCAVASGVPLPWLWVYVTNKSVSSQLPSAVCLVCSHPHPSRQRLSSPSTGLADGS